MSATKFFAYPLVAAFITLSVRLVVFSCRDYLSLPYRFGITTPNADAEVWKEAVFWQQRFGHVPEYLSTVIPWYAPHIPPAPSLVYVIVLCVCDAATAFLVSGWPSATPQLLYTLLVLNPVMVLLPVLESLAPLQSLALTFVLECIRRRHVYPKALWLARLFAPALGFFFLAIHVALWMPLAHRTATSASMAALFGAAGIGAMAMAYLYWGAASGERTSLYAPPDNGPMWYVRLLIIPAFARCLEVFLIQLPALLTLPLVVVVPQTERVDAEPGTVPADRRLLLVLFAVCASKLCCHHLLLADYALVALFMYTLLGRKPNPRADGKSMFEVMREQNVFVPVYALLIVVPLQHSFYTGWVMWDTANPNWVFFPQVAFALVGTMFLLMFMNVVVTMVMPKNEEKVKKA